MPRIRVLVVDDSVVIRRLVSDVLSGDPGIEVVGTAPNGKLALTKLAQLAPDVLTMDVEMPEMDGISAVRAMRGSRLPVIMFSTLTERGASATLDALEAGASDYVTKPANVGCVAQAMDQVRAQLIPKIKALLPRGGTGTPAPVGAAAARRPAAGVRAGARGAPAATPAAASGSPAAADAAPHSGRPAATMTMARPRREGPFRLLAVGCSTGGPEALSRFLSSFPGDLPVPVVVVQHMPPVFTRQFAARLDRQHKVRVLESAGGEALEPGWPRRCCRWTSSEPLCCSGCRPTAAVACPH